MKDYEKKTAREEMEKLRKEREGDLEQRSNG